jgi:hypothetical protein
MAVWAVGPEGTGTGLDEAPAVCAGAADAALVLKNAAQRRARTPAILAARELLITRVVLPLVRSGSPETAAMLIQRDASGNESQITVFSGSVVAPRAQKRPSAVLRPLSSPNGCDALDAHLSADAGAGGLGHLGHLFPTAPDRASSRLARGPAPLTARSRQVNAPVVVFDHSSGGRLTLRGHARRRRSAGRDSPTLSRPTGAAVEPRIVVWRGRWARGRVRPGRGAAIA